jgi:hypothetical protein
MVLIDEEEQGAQIVHVHLTVVLGRGSGGGAAWE